MNRRYLSLGILVGCLTTTHSVDSRATELPHLWSQRFGDQHQQNCYAVATDPSGNVIVAGYFDGTVNFGGGDLTSAGGWDIFVAKFTPGGGHVWSKRFGDGESQYPTCVTTDASGNVIVGGLFDGTVNFGGGNLFSSNGDIFLVKFSSSGGHQWSKRFGSASNELVASVATDASGNVLITGDFWLVVNFGGGTLTSAGYADIFVAKFDAAGVHQWSQRFGAPDNQWGESVVADENGNVIVAGSFVGTVDFGGGVLTSAGMHDVFMVKFNSVGVHQWSHRFGGASSQFPKSVATDESGDLVVMGQFTGTIDFGGGVLTTAGGSDIFVARFSSTMAHQWSHRFGDANFQYAGAMATDANGNAALTGYFNGAVDFGGGDLTSAGGYDIFVANLDATGVHRWSESFGDTLYQYGHAVATDPNGNMIVSGHFAGTVDFGGGDLTSAGGDDVFVVKFGGQPTGAGDSPEASGLSLSAFPNPFNPSTTIRYTVSSKGRVIIAVYDARGVCVATLLDEEREAGMFTVPWSGRSDAGTIASSGVYFARITHASGTKSYKLVLLK